VTMKRDLSQCRQKRRYSPNELPVPVLPKELKSHITVIKPSRASLTYERME